MDAERLLLTFLDLVRIDSPSTHEGAVASYLSSKFIEIGCTVRLDDTTEQTGSETGNLIAELPGTIPVTLVLSAHMDCVEPCRGVVPVIRDGRIEAQGDTVLGADDKVGIAVALEVMRVLAASDQPRPTVRAVFTVMEEVGLQGSKSLAEKDVECDLCLVLDSDGVPGTIVVGAPFHHTFKAQFTGVATHAGVAPEKGVSAIAMAASAISSMQIGRLDEETTANIGTISGGSADNVVAARCDVTGECRSLSRERAAEVRDAMERSMREAAEMFGGTVETAWELEYEGFHYAQDDPRVELVSKAAVRCGLAPRLHLSGGGSDANILSGKGVPVLVLGTGMTGFHSTDESLAIADLEDAARLVLAIAEDSAALA